MNSDGGDELVAALGRGNPAEVRALIERGANVRHVREHGYTALVDAVHGRDVARDPGLLDLLRLLIEQRVDLNGVTSYEESGLRVLSRLGRFDAVRLLLDAGANVDARGRCGATPMSYAVEGHHAHVVRWLLDIGQDVDQKNDFGITPLMEAAEANDVECADVLIAAGADVDYVSPSGSVLCRAGTRELIQRLLAAGADPRHLTHDGQRRLCRPGEVDPAPLVAVTPEQFRRRPSRVFGSANPQRMQEPFWEAMIRAGVSAYEAGRAFGPEAPHAFSPVWCAQRFGQSITFLPDGRIVQVGGEHEDFCDDDFCIYNDVFVHDTRGAIAIYGYPEEVFPPTDFHTATLVGGAIYVIGSLGYVGTRRYGHTPVYRLDTTTFAMERLDTSGDAPGSIFEHRARLLSPHEIRVAGGLIASGPAGKEVHEPDGGVFVLDLHSLAWRRGA